QIRSVHASPTPPQERATSRNATSQYPAIGASSRFVARRWLPSWIGSTGIGERMDAPFQHLYGQRREIAPAKLPAPHQLSAHLMREDRAAVTFDVFVMETAAEGFGDPAVDGREQWDVVVVIRRRGDPGRGAGGEG